MTFCSANSIWLAIVVACVCANNARAQVKTLVAESCIHCHDESTDTSLNFDALDFDLKDEATFSMWERIYDRVSAGEMPPEDEDQPSAEDLAKILNTLTTSVNEAHKRLTDHGGEIKMRRLNKREYSNTIRHLFGFTVNPHNIPSDGEIVTFDTVGNEQFYTSAHFDQYLELARGITTKALSLNNKPHKKVTKQRTEPEKNHNEKLTKDLKEKDRKKALLDAGKTWQEAGFKDEGEMKILLSQWESRAELPRAYLKLPKASTGFYLSDIDRSVSVNHRIDHRAEYLIHLHGGIVGTPHEARKIIRLHGKDNIHGTLLMNGTIDQPATISMRVRKHGDTKSGLLSFSISENKPNTYRTVRKFLQKLGAKASQADPNATPRPF